MSPVKFVSLEEFHARKLLPGESLSVFVHQLKRLLNQAMPTVDAGTKGQLLLHQFVTGLPSRVSKQLRAVGEINDLDKVLERAKLLLTMDEQEKTAAIKTTERLLEMEVLQQQVSVLSEQVAALTSRLPRGDLLHCADATTVASQGTFSAIAQSSGDAIPADGRDTQLESVGRETREGRSTWARDVLGDSRPFQHGE